MELRLAEAKAMKALNPKMKVIAILCDPIKRAFSLMSMNVRNYKTSLQDEIDILNDVVEHHQNEARTFGEFVDIIQPFQKILGKENVLILDGEIDEKKGFPCLFKPAKR